MQDHVSRLVRLEGFEVKRVIEEGDQLDLEAELVADAGSCPRCGRPSVDVKGEAVRAGARSAARGAVTYLVWGQARLPRRALRAQLHRAAPRAPSRQQLSRRFRAHLLERTRCGAAHAEVARDEQTTRYQAGGPSSRATTSSPGRARSFLRGASRSTSSPTAGASGDS
jgi:hypothetical protein